MNYINTENYSIKYFVDTSIANYIRIVLLDIECLISIGDNFPDDFVKKMLNKGWTLEGIKSLESIITNPHNILWGTRGQIDITNGKFKGLYSK